MGGRGAKTLPTPASEPSSLAPLLFYSPLPSLSPLCAPFVGPLSRHGPGRLFWRAAGAAQGCDKTFYRCHHVL